MMDVLLASMLPVCASTLAGMPYADRFLEGLARPGKTRAGVARAMGVSVQAISSIVNGHTKAATAANNAAAAGYFGCDPTWLATGVGSPRWGEAPTLLGAGPTVTELLDRLHEFVTDADPGSRDAAMQLVVRYLERPEARIAQVLELLLLRKPAIPHAAEAPQVLTPGTEAFASRTQKSGLQLPANKKERRRKVG